MRNADGRLHRGGDPREFFSSDRLSLSSGLSFGGLSWASFDSVINVIPQRSEEGLALLLNKK